jgi:hypothetical protein
VNNQEDVMSELYEWIKQQVTAGLQVSLSGIKNLSRKMDDRRPPKFIVGDDIVFDVIIRNNNSFPLGGLDVSVHQTESV